MHTFEPKSRLCGRSGRVKEESDGIRGGSKADMCPASFARFRNAGQDGFWERRSNRKLCRPRFDRSQAVPDVSYAWNCRCDPAVALKVAIQSGKISADHPAFQPRSSAKLRYRDTLKADDD